MASYLNFRKVVFEVDATLLQGRVKIASSLWDCFDNDDIDKSFGGELFKFYEQKCDLILSEKVSM